ncbi:MAG: glycosyltransferase family 2 protein [Bacteroidota bacterium]
MVNLHPETPFFSIVVPVYNRYELVRETIQSILLQEMQDFEIVIVDDGSNDGSGEKLDSAFGKVPAIRIIHQHNLERGAARNRGLKDAKGVYVIFLDSDDRLMTNHLTVLYHKLQSLNFPNFIATKFEFLRDDRKISSDISKYKEGYYNYRLFLHGNPLACNVCIKKNNPNLFLFEEDRKFAIKEDWLFFLQNLRRQELYLIDDVTLVMLDHPDRSMQGDNKVLISKTQSAKKWILENVELDAVERRKLDAHVNYFCAIHSYIDSERINALRFLSAAFKYGGIKSKYVVLLFKILVGKKILNRIKQ